MSLRTAVGAMGNLLDERPEHCRRVAVPQPVLGLGEHARLRRARRARLRDGHARQRSTGRPRARRGSSARSTPLCRAASRAVWDGASIVILSDRGVDADRAPDPAAAGASAVHSHLVREGARAMCGLVVESGEPRETMHVALLLGYGAAAVYPYLALETALQPRRAGRAVVARRQRSPASGRACSRCAPRWASRPSRATAARRSSRPSGSAGGSSTATSPAPSSRVGGIGLADIARRRRARGTRAAFAAAAADARSSPAATTSYRRGGEHHVWDPEPIVRLQRAVRDDEPRDVPRTTPSAIDARVGAPGHAARPARARAGRAAVPLDEVEPATEIVDGSPPARCPSARSRAEAHETLAIAMNRLGGALQHRRGRRGSGPLDPRRERRPAPLGDQAGRLGALRRHGRLPGRRRPAADQDRAGRQARRGRPAARPQGRRADRAAAPLDARRGPDLAAAAPRHLLDRGPRAAHLRPEAREPAAPRSASSWSPRPASARSPPAWPRPGPTTSSSPATTAAPAPRPLSSLKHAGLPWELGLAETQQVLVANGLREPRARCRSTAACARGRDVLVARAARRRGVRLLDRAAGRGGLRHDARLPPQHVPGRHRDAGSRAAPALHRHARARRPLLPASSPRSVRELLAALGLALARRASSAAPTCCASDAGAGRSTCRRCSRARRRAGAPRAQRAGRPRAGRGARPRAHRTAPPGARAAARRRWCSSGPWRTPTARRRAAVRRDRAAPRPRGLRRRHGRRSTSRAPPARASARLPRAA